MGKFLFRFFLIFLVAIFSGIFFLSYFGLETDKFDSFIKNKANQVNKNVKLEFNKTKIHLDISDLKLLLRLQNPKILLRNNEIDLSRLDLLLSLQSFYTSDFMLEKADLAFEKNDIKDLTKITKIFLPKILNKQLKKIFSRGNLEGELVIPFNSDGTLNKNYTFYGKVLDTDINISKEYKLKNLSAEISYDKSSIKEIDGLKIVINKGKFLSLELLESLIQIKFEDKKKLINSSIHTKGKLESNEIKKISSLFGFKNSNFESVNLVSDLTTNIKFNIDDRFKVRNLSCAINGDVNEFKITIKEKKIIKDFIPSFNTEITLKDSKINFNASESINGDYSFKLNGKVKFDEKFEKIKINQFYKKKDKKYSVDGSLTLEGSSLNNSKLNYKKEKNEQANLIFNTNFILGKYFFIENLTYVHDQSEIILNKIKLSKNLEVTDFKDLKIKTYDEKLKNNHFSIKKSDKIVILGEIFDAEPLLKSLYKKSSGKIFSKEFKGNLKVNFDKAITGTNDNIYNFGMIALNDKGSYTKLSSKGNFSDSEIGKCAENWRPKFWKFTFRFCNS